MLTEFDIKRILEAKREFLEKVATPVPYEIIGDSEQFQDTELESSVSEINGVT